MDNDATPEPQAGLVLLAHGSRDALWRQPIEAVLHAVQQSGPTPLACCAYLEACEPDLPTAAQGLIDAGATQLTVLPLFLGTGKHAREDIPRLVELIRARHPQVRVHLQPAVGEHPRVTALLAELARQAAGAQMQK
ncbi:Sirohydrochlorin cobaltochelatase [Delftia tsuruhatensis]|uniref:sirohydrochlorin chelatase n=1 Tax=Delftia tsuruhatensis TaxID=180282 RepID=UPI001E76CFD6|nr:CbiX/SirB N-terminal domain-containing protein [Delftia tsuruhatensis]CAB5673518.1 Sirohydrochlorin cobaltochelatase [Delftia tsuruhatensis]CAC9683664.1 Sirohydrochlorin cobaltochelatase [Delftia tsuruhatensis]